jgi:hypothetical protein
MAMRQKCSNWREKVAQVREVFPTVLRAAIGPGQRVANTEALALVCGRSEATVQRYLGRATLPDLATGIVLMDVLGPDFAAPLLLQAGLAGAFRVDGAAPAGETLKEVVEGAAALAAAWADLRIDHSEWPTVRRELTQAMVCIAQFLATGGAR